MAAQKKIPKRSEVDKQYTWATEDLFATDELWEKALEKHTRAGWAKARTRFTAS